MFEKLKDSLADAKSHLNDKLSDMKDSMLNSVANSAMLKNFIKDVADDYLEVHNIEKAGKSFTLTVSLKGSSEKFDITINRIEFIEERAFCLKGLSANMIWANNILANFVEAKEFPLPESAKKYLPLLKQIL